VASLRLSAGRAALASVSEQVQLTRIGPAECWVRARLAERLARPGGVRPRGQHAVELAPGADADLGEHVAGTRQPTAGPGSS
jgi:hypothetical protein